MTKPTSEVDLGPLDKLEDKVRQLVAIVGRLRADQDRLAGENARLARDLDTAQARVAEFESISGELRVLKDERDAVRTRVGDLLAQLDSLNL